MSDIRNVISVRNSYTGDIRDITHRACGEVSIWHKKQKVLLLLDYTRLTAFFQDNLGKPVPEW